MHHFYLMVLEHLYLNLMLLVFQRRMNELIQPYFQNQVVSRVGGRDSYDHWVIEYSFLEQIQ